MQKVGDDETMHERLSRLETNVQTLLETTADLRRDLNHIGDLIAESRRTNWPLVISALALTGALYAAAIRPVEIEQRRLGGNIIDMEQRIGRFRDEQVGNTARIGGLEKQMDVVNTDGSPVVQRRLAVVEDRLKISAK